MAEVKAVTRKNAVLRRPSLPCLSRWHTINLLSGCPCACRYCYARSFRSYPGEGRVLFYENTLDLLRRELPRKRAKPDVVYFSTACEPFAPNASVLTTLHGVMKLLLEHGVRILISTKMGVPDRFYPLFERFRALVFVQVGLTTTDDRVRRAVEPRAASVRKRLDVLENLCSHGIPAEARLDPLIPELTDRDESLDALLAAISNCGASTAAASYLFLRRPVTDRMRFSLGSWSFHDMANRIYSGEIRNYCAGSHIRVADAEYRRERFAALKSIAMSHGIALRLCHCKNPDLTAECCHPSFEDPTDVQLNLDLE